MSNPKKRAEKEIKMPKWYDEFCIFVATASDSPYIKARILSHMAAIYGTILRKGRVPPKPQRRTDRS